MLRKLYARYESKSTATRNFKMGELVSLKFMNAHEDTSRHVDRLNEHLEQFSEMSTLYPESLSIGIITLEIFMLYSSERIKNRISYLYP